MALLKNYLPEKWDSPILYIITAEMVQSMVEPNLDHRLTDVEIERMHYAMLDNTENYHELMTFIMTSAEQAIDTKKNDWSGIDKDFHNRKTLETINGYEIGSDSHEQ
jgi:hypothetical protein